MIPWGDPVATECACIEEKLGFLPVLCDLTVPTDDIDSACGKGTLSVHDAGATARPPTSGELNGVAASSSAVMSLRSGLDPLEIVQFCANGLEVKEEERVDDGGLRCARSRPKGGDPDPVMIGLSILWA